MSSITVAEFASELKKTPETLLEQLKSAGVAKRASTDALTETCPCRLPLLRLPLPGLKCRRLRLWSKPLRFRPIRNW